MAPVDGPVRFSPAWLVGFPALALAVAIFVAPLLFLLSEAFGTSLSANFWNDIYFWHVVRFTYWQAFLSSVTSLVCGVGLAILYSDFRFRGRQLLWDFALLPFSLPVILVVLGFSGFWGRSGWLNSVLESLGLSSFESFYGWFAILVVHTFFNAPLFFRNVGQVLLETDRDAEKAALSLGASRFRTFCSVTLWKLLPAIRSTFGLSFLYCASSFLVILLLGGGPKFTTLEVAIYEATAIDWDPVLVARLAAFQVLIGLLVFWLCHPTREQWGRENKSQVRLYGARSKLASRIVVSLWIALVAILFLLPLLTLLFESARGIFSVFGSELSASVKLSLKLALMTGGISTLWAFGLVYWERHTSSVLLRKILASVASLPMMLSTLLLTAAWIVCAPNLHHLIRGSHLSIALVQAVGCLPLVSIVLREALYRIPEEYYKVTQTYGANRWQQMFRLELPLLLPSLLTGFLIASSFSLGEVGSVLLLLSEGIATLPLWIYRMMGNYEFQSAYGVGGILILGLLSLHILIGKVEKWLWS